MRILAALILAFALGCAHSTEATSETPQERHDRKQKEANERYEAERAKANARYEEERKAANERYEKQRAKDTKKYADDEKKRSEGAEKVEGDSAPEDE